ncbi:MAG TPA: threonine synthase [Candidatus Cybelea sp.]|nr:threonine synthase [Candidatus Cybelea sp.]
MSTRGRAPVLGFEDVLLAGLARDGGLYVPESWPKLDPATLKGFAGRPYHDVAAAVMRPFLGGAVDDKTFDTMVREAYATFDHAAVAPLVQLGPNDWVLELFHGPTLAFKDFALQLLGRLLDHTLERRRRRATVVGATSGDTGAAAIEACRGKDAIDVFILHPEGRISQVQRRQMTTVPDANVHNIAVQGTFDDCQALVKAMFNDLAFRDALNLSAVNSINWARVMAQIVYYVTAAVALGAPDRAIAFSVPTGNFGDVFAGYGAKQMGLPVAKLLVATNRNDIVARFFDSGTYRAGKVEATMSPSMDIQVSSNFERLLFDLCGRDGAAVDAYMSEFAAKAEYRVGDNQLAQARPVFDAARINEPETAKTIARVLAETGWLPDPHTAVGLAAAKMKRGDPSVPMVTLATAHAAKFPDAVERATGIRPQLPPRLADLGRRPERCERLLNDVAQVKAYIRANSRVAAGVH